LNGRPEADTQLIQRVEQAVGKIKPIAAGASAAGLLAFFFAVQWWQSGFAAMHRYGADPDGRNWIFRFSPEEILYAVSLCCLALPAALLLAAALRPVFTPVRMGRLAAWAESVSPIGFLPASAVVAVVLLHLIARYVLHYVPLTDDENTYIFMAKIIASGQVTLPSHQAMEFFDNVFVINNGQWFGQFQFGFPAVLAAGYLLGHPYLPVILLSAFIPGFIYLTAREAYNPRAALAAGLLALGSPYYLAMSSTLLAHSVTLLFLSVSAWFCVRTGNRSGWRDPAMAALFGGIALHIRPLTAALVLAGPSAAMLYCRAKRSRAALIQAVVAAAIPALAAVAGLLMLNQLVNGHALLTNYDVKWERDATVGHILGFGQYPWDITHTPCSGLRNALMNLTRINFWLWGWPVSLVFVVWWARFPGKRIWDWAWTSSIAVSFLFYYFYFWPGVSDTGPVLYSELLLPFALLTVRGMEAAAFRISPGWTLRFSLASAVIAWATFHQVQVLALNKTAWDADEPYRLMDERRIHNAVVFMDYYIKPLCARSWVAGRRNPSPDLLDDRLYVLDLNLCREKIAFFFPHRRFFRFTYSDEDDQPRIEPVFLEIPRTLPECFSTPVTDLPTILAKLKGEPPRLPVLQSRPDPAHQFRLEARTHEAAVTVAPTDRDGADRPPLKRDPPAASPAAGTIPLQSRRGN